MALHRRRGVKKQRKPMSKVGVIPAPLGGINGRISLAANDLSVCPYAYNIIPNEKGMDVRKGYREWAIELETSTAHGVGTIIPYHSVDGTADKLFVVTNEGIWDVTTYDTPTAEVAFSSFTDANVGYGTYVNYTDAAGAEFILYADNFNGLYTYTASTDTWAATTGINNVAEANICGIVVHKLRVWLIERDSTNGWYLPVNAIAGDATQFTFGGKFKKGGRLTGLFNWTLDGGDGVDDYLVAVSSAGDVLPYQGEDPSSASTWSLRGTYQIGDMPDNYRAGFTHGGELYLLSAYGLVAMSDTIRGVRPDQPEMGSLGYKISSILRTSMATLRGENGWNMEFLPSEGVLIIVSPVQTDGSYIQYVVNLVTRGWAFWRGPPILSIGVWNNEVYFGTSDDRVFIMDVYRDEQLITPAGDVNGDPIEFSMLHSYSDLDAPGSYKRGHMVRPNFRANYEPVFDSKILYDYDLAEFSANYASLNSNVGLWDSGTWDVSTWGADVETPFSRVAGANGIGRSLAVALKGRAEEKTTLISTDVVWDGGDGIL